MQKIASFTVDHTKLLPGLYVSRKDKKEQTIVTTFDLRFKKPNVEPAIPTAPLHAIEHLGATFLRNSKIKKDVIYFGPMGCRTGFYLVLFGDLAPKDVYPYVIEMLNYIINYSGVIPGASPIECGNFLDLDLKGAKELALDYKTDLTTCRNFDYPK